MQSLVIGSNEGESWWQPQPSGGYVTTYITPEPVSYTHLTLPTTPYV